MNNKIEVSLKYGDKRINFYLEDKNIIGILTAKRAISLKEPIKSWKSYWKIQSTAFLWSN